MTEKQSTPSLGDAVLHAALIWYSIGRGKAEAAHELEMCVMRFREAIKEQTS